MDGVVEHNAKYYNTYEQKKRRLLMKDNKQQHADRTQFSGCLCTEIIQLFNQSINQQKHIHIVAKTHTHSYGLSIGPPECLSSRSGNDW